ncbi:MAG: radical SAM protein [Candidatus Brockarchaeota archaeon]|nr:radical SAM protein [Candidatus Brockarchaeota archaeon]MBO3809501.1 radical SAM protein [Candidatus Brockarchaeota archaeon]
MEKYQRFLAPGFKPFDPIRLAEETERVVTRLGSEGLERKYTGFYSMPVYRGIATGYAVGCCLRCIFCWSNWSRDFPEKFGEYYSPKEAARRLFKAAEEGISYSKYWRRVLPKVDKLRISGCEPTIGMEHLLKVLEHVKTSKYSLFILETNGVILGFDVNHVKRLVDFRSKLYVRVSFKAATPEGFTTRTGAQGKFYELPFKALKHLLDEGIHARAAAMTDRRIMPEEERRLLIQMLDEIDPEARYSETLEEEVIDAYDTSVKRLKAFADKEYAERLKNEMLGLK